MAPRPPDAIYGRLFEGSNPIRDLADKYHVSLKDYPASSYSNYVAGSSYVPGGHVVETLSRATGQVKLFPIEDVYITSSRAESAGVRRVGLYRFHSQSGVSLLHAAAGDVRTPSGTNCNAWNSYDTGSYSTLRATVML